MENVNLDISKDELIEIHPEYVYMTIPSEYVCLHNKLLVYLSEFGIDLLKDCSAGCTSKNKTIIDCWNMFQSMIACYNLGQKDLAETFKKYIEAQLEIYYNGSNKEVYNGGIIYPITPDGHLKAQVSCSNDIKFYVDPTTGKLYEEYLENSKDKEFSIENNNLVVKSKFKI